MKRFDPALMTLIVVGAALAWILSAPSRLSDAAIAALPSGDAKSGELVFWAGGCASCHAAPKAKDEARLILAGSLEFKTPFGTFRAPNISPDRENGIGRWSLGDFANAMRRGVRPDGKHYYPAFPYSSYTRMTDRDVADLWAFMKTLPPSDMRVADHDLSFPFNIRRGLGFWKLLYLNANPVLTVDESDAVLTRGRYLVEALGHCGECHTPRNAIGGIIKNRWLAGGVAPEGNEKIPNITPHADGIGAWSVAEIVYALETGFTPEFDSFGSSMADVVENMARLPEDDRKAIAAYLQLVSPVAKDP